MNPCYNHEALMCAVCCVLCAVCCAGTCQGRPCVATTARRTLPRTPARTRSLKLTTPLFCQGRFHSTCACPLSVHRSPNAGLTISEKGPRYSRYGTQSDVYVDRARLLRGEDAFLVVPVGVRPWQVAPASTLARTLPAPCPHPLLAVHTPVFDRAG